MLLLCHRARRVGSCVLLSLHALLLYLYNPSALFSHFHQHNIVRYPISQVNPSDSDTWWIENNGATTLQTALNASLFQASSASEGTSSIVSVSNYAVLGIAMGVFLLVALGAILPATAVVLEEQDSIYLVFAQVPVQVVRHLRNSLASKIQALKQFEESNGEDTMLELGEGEGQLGMEAASAASAAAAAAAIVAANELAAAGKSPKKSACCTRRGGGAASSGVSAAVGSGVRHFRRASDKQAALMVRLLWPIIFFCFYFGLTFYWREIVNMEAAFFRNEVLWGAELQVLIPTVAYALRNALVYGAPKTWVPTWLSLTTAQLNLASELVDSLSYGSTSRGLRPALSSSASAYKILVENGCVRNEVDAATCANYGTRPCNYYYAYEQCKIPDGNTDINYVVFDSGIVGTGLLPSLREFLLKARNLVAERSAALAADPSDQLPRVDLAAPPLSVIDQLGHEYLPAGLEALSAGRITEDSAYLSQFAQLNLMATLLCIVALLGFYVLAYRPLFASLDKDIKGARGLLLLLPDEAARSVPAVMTAGKKLLSGS